MIRDHRHRGSRVNWMRRPSRWKVAEWIRLRVLYRWQKFSTRVWSRHDLLCVDKARQNGWIGRIHGARGCSHCYHPRCYPWLCTEVLNAIIHYKDTIGNSMARVLCSAHSLNPSQRDFLPTGTWTNKRQPHTILWLVPRSRFLIS